MPKRTIWDRLRNPDEGTGARSFYNWIAAIPKWARGYRDGLPNHLLGYEVWILRRAFDRAIHPSLFELAAMIGVPTGAWIAVGKLAGAEAAIWSGIVSILCILFVFMAIEGWKAWKEVATRGDLLRTEVRIREKFLSQDEMARVQIGVAFRGPGTAKSCTARVYELAYCFHDRDDSGAVVSKWADLTRKDVVGPQPLVWAQSEGCADSSGFILDIPSDGDIRLLDVLKMYKNGHSLVATTRNPSETPIGRSQAGDNSIIKIGIRVTSQDTPAITKRVVLCVRKIDPPMVGALGITANLWSERDEAEYLERRRNAEPLWEGPI